jgi:hypothetical protein
MPTTIETGIDKSKNIKEWMGIEPDFEARQEKFRERLSFRHIDMTGLEIKKEKEETQAHPAKRLLEKIGYRVKPLYSNEYIKIKRRSFIVNLLESVNEIKTFYDDMTAKQMSLDITKSEIHRIYKTFLQTGQDENFLSIVGLIEESLFKNEFNKKTLSDINLILKQLLKKDVIEYSDYEMVVNKFIDSGLNIIGIIEEHSKE